MEPTNPTPALSPANITGSPSSTYAGIGLLALSAGQMMQAQPMPTTTAGWIAFAIPLVMGALSMFSRSSIPSK